MTRNQALLYLVLLVVLIVLSGSLGSPHALNIYEFWDLLSK